MDQQRFEYLLERYKFHRLSAGEWKEWEEAIESERFKSIIEADMEEALALGSRHKDWTEEREGETWQNILSSRSETRSRGRIFSMKLRLALIGVAAACILIAGAWWFFRPSAHSSQKIVDISSILPGGDKAVLTLGDGTSLLLDSSAGHPLARQGSVAIVKLTGSRVMYHSYNNDPSDKLVYNQLETPRGARYELVLPDGTRVWLNAASSLRYPTAFTGQSREVTLIGEAYFEVAPNPGKPFKVVTKDWKADVLGTSFDIKAYPGDPESYATLLEGSIKVEDPGTSLLLKPGQTAVTATGKKGWQLRKLLPGQAIAWTNNQFSFDKTPLPEVMQQLERWYDVRLECSPEAEKSTISGGISRQEEILTVLKMLEYTSDIHYTIDGRKILLTMGTARPKSK